jgi:hypothetical protein
MKSIRDTADCIGDIEYENVLDSRDLQKIIERLDDEKTDADNAQSEYDDAQGDYDADMAQFRKAHQEWKERADPDEEEPEAPEAPDELEEFDSDKKELLETLEALKEDMDLRRWHDGVAFVNESYFEEFAKNEAEELGYLANVKGNPLEDCIDWEKWADKVKDDYSTADIGSSMFYYRDA